MELDEFIDVSRALGIDSRELLRQLQIDYTTAKKLRYEQEKSEEQGD